MATIAGAGPGPSQGPGGPSKSPTWVQRPKHLGHLPLHSQAHQQGTGPEVEQARVEQVPMMNAGTVGSSLTLYTTGLVPPSLFHSSAFHRVSCLFTFSPFKYFLSVEREEEEKGERQEDCLQKVPSLPSNLPTPDTSGVISCIGKVRASKCLSI